MKFSKDDLIELVSYGHDGLTDFEPVEIKLVGSRRWVDVYRLIFSYRGKFYMTKYDQGKTECQETELFEYEKDMIECPEVKAVEKTYIDYELV